MMLEEATGEEAAMENYRQRFCLSRAKELCMQMQQFSVLARMLCSEGTANHPKERNPPNVRGRKRPPK